MKRSTLNDYKQRILRVLVHIQRNLDESTPLEELAAIAAFSPYHFHRVFRGMVGESVKEYIRRLRLERAAMRLKLSAMPITRIALEAGYESHQAFTRAFKAGYGVSPSAYRAGKGAHQPTPSGGMSYQEGGVITDFEPLTWGGEAMQVQIKKLEPMRIAFVRHTGPYNECGSAWEKLSMQLGMDGLLAGDARFIGLCHDDPDVTPADKIRYDACCTIGDDFQPHGDIGVTLIDGGEYAMTTHFGPFEQIGDTYARLFGDWLPRSGSELRAAPCLEIYLTDPENTEPEDYVTDIFAPLQTSLRGRV